MTNESHREEEMDGQKWCQGGEAKTCPWGQLMVFEDCINFILLLEEMTTNVVA